MDVDTIEWLGGDPERLDIAVYWLRPIILEYAGVVAVEPRPESDGEDTRKWTARSIAGEHIPIVRLEGEFTTQQLEDVLAWMHQRELCHG